jgi:imidazolonepropionase-like amidohydrolase
MFHTLHEETVYRSFVPPFVPPLVPPFVPTIIAAALCAVSPAFAQQQGPTLVLIHANVIDAIHPRPIANATVVVNGRDIERIETGAKPPPAGAPVIDLQGRYLLPGLIDAHTHINSLTSARRALESGVTTVRSASTLAFQDVGLRELVRSGALPGPDVLAAGVFVTPDLGESILADTALASLYGGVNSDEELRRLVQINLKHGVDVIKTRATERAGLPNTDPRKQVYTEAQLRVIVEAAAAGGLGVMVHAHGDEGALAAVRAGARSIEHGTYLSDSTLALMKRKGTWLVPTYSTIVDLSEPGGDYEDPVLELRGKSMLPVARKMFQHAYKMGVRIATGADTDYGPKSLTRISTEVVNFVDMGMSPFDAIRSATSAAAELLGIERRTGTIQPGYEADLIVVEGNPLEDIRLLQDVEVVISNGRVALNRLPFGKESR